MPQYKVIFEVDLIFPPNRITRKKASNIFTAIQEIEMLKAESEVLAQLLSADVENQFKTAKVLGLDITSIEYYPKKSQSKEKVNDTKANA